MTIKHITAPTGVHANQPQAINADEADADQHTKDVLLAAIHKLASRRQAIAAAHVFAAPGGVVASTKQSPVDQVVHTLTTTNVGAKDAVAEWNSLSTVEQRQLVAKLIEKHPATAAEFANQLGQAKDKTAADGFWKHAETWMTTTVADWGYYGRLPEARAFMEEVAMLHGAAGKATKGRAARVVSNIPFSKEFGELSDRAARSGNSSVVRAELERSMLHLDTWRKEMRSGTNVSLSALARRDPVGFVKHLDGLKGDKKAFDAAVNVALSQPSVDFTGRGVRGSYTTDPYTENLVAAIAKHGSPTVKADFALRLHKGGSLRPGYKFVKDDLHELMVDHRVLSIMIHKKAEPFSKRLGAVMKSDPKQAQRIIGAGVTGYTVAYQAAMTAGPVDVKAAKQAAYDLGLLLGETKEAAKEAFKADPAQASAFLAGLFKIASKQILGLIPGGHLAADLSKEVLAELSGHFVKQATSFNDDASGKKLEEAIELFVGQTFAATRDSFWTLRDPKDLRNKVKQSKELDKIEDEYKQFNERLAAGYAAGRDSDDNASRTR